jgi:exopolyphosphatase/guanosine-5'-triphosphate,3'-diphosphate pyrophosphatase
MKKKKSRKKGPKLATSRSVRRFASIDVGSNGIRMVIGELTKNSDLYPVITFREAVRLGRDVFRDGYVREPTARKAAKAFVKFAKIMKKYRVKNYWAVATSAVRDAKNGKDFIQFLRQKSGLTLEVIDGIREGKLIHMAITSRVNLSHRVAVLIDIGGGSVELAISRFGKIVGVETFPLGTVRMLNQTDMFFLSNKSPIIEKILNKSKSDVQRFLKRHLKGARDFTFIGTGGNIECLGELKPLMLKKENTTKLSASELSTMTKRLNKMTFDERVQSLKLKTDRADVILPACLALQMVMRICRAREVLIPKVGLKDGVLIEIARRFTL